jgi:hypothetical protein
MIEHPSGPDNAQNPISRRHFVAGLVASMIIGGHEAESQSAENTPAPDFAEIFPYVSLEQVSEEIKRGIHEKIKTDGDFHCLHSIRDSIFDELRTRWVQPTSVWVQIVPFNKNKNGEYDYLELSISSIYGEKKEHLDITLSTSDTEWFSIVLWNMINTFQQHIDQVALMVFQQEFERAEVFRRGIIEGKINETLRPEFESYMKNCIEYKWTTIFRGEDGKAEIRILILDIPTQKIGYLSVPTDIVIPPKQESNGPMELVQNTPETVESIHSLAQ